MMILVLLGGTRTAQARLVEELEEEVSSDFHVSHIDNNPELHNQDQKYANLTRLTTSRIGRDTVTIVTGVNSKPEFEILSRHRAVFCVIPGVLPRILSRGEIAITPEFLYVASKSIVLTTEEKRRVYGSILHAFSECYSREMQLNRRG